MAHGLDALTKRAGWWFALCGCGVESPPAADREIAAEAWADHRQDAADRDVSDAMRVELGELVVWMDADLDAEVAERYREQPLAQDWARVAKVGEEAGEAIDALIGITGQNPRKGEYGALSDLLDELADVSLTGLYAMQHFTKEGAQTLELLLARARYHRMRREAQSS